MTNIADFANNDSTTLAASITTSQTTITVVSGTGAEFPSPASGSFFSVTLISATNSSTYEICYCTARSGDTLTVTRAQEGTTATAFNAGDTVANMLTAGVMSLIPQLGTNNAWSGSNTFSQTGTFSAGVTANGYDAGSAQFRAVNGNYGAFIHNDGTNFYLLASNSGTPYGSFSSLRPFQFNLSTGAVTIDGTGAGTSLDGPVTANGYLTATAGSTFGPTTFTNNVTANGYLTATAGSTFGPTTFTNNVTVDGTLSVVSTTLFESAINIAGGGVVANTQPSTDASSNISNDYWVQGAIAHAITTTSGNGITYEKYASGKIVFRGNCIIPAGSLSATISLPLAFPNSFDGGVASDAGASLYTYSVEAGPNLSTIVVNCQVWTINQSDGTIINRTGVAGGYFVAWGN